MVIAGIPFDIGTTNRPGARFGPQAIRQASRMLVDGDHPKTFVDVPRLPLAGHERERITALIRKGIASRPKAN